MVRNLTVASGTVSIANPAAIIHVGLSFTSDLETLELNASEQGGVLQDKQRQPVELTARLKSSRAFLAGPNFDKLLEVAFRTTENYGDPIQPFTGDKTLSVYAGDEVRSARLCVRNEDPVPLTILALIPIS